MDWMTILTPIISFVLSGLTSWVMVWLAKYLKAKYNISISEDQFEAAKKAVLAIEEKALCAVTKPSGAKKNVEAVSLLKQALPGIDQLIAQRKIDEAVAVLPGIGCTGKLPLVVG